MKRVVIKQFSPKFKILDPSVKKIFKGLKGGRGSGKSHAMARQLIAITNEYKTFVVCAREYLESIADSSYKLLIDTIDAVGLSDQYIITKNEIVHKFTGSRIIFRGVKTNPESIKSLEKCNIIWLDEAQQVSEGSWEIIIPTIIRNKGAQIWASWNPRLPTDAVELIFNPAKNPDCVCEHINYLENPHVDDALIRIAERMREEDPAKYEWIYLGGYMPQGDQIWIGMSELMPAFGRIVAPNDLIGVVAGWDLGYTNDRSVLHIRHGDRLLHTQIWRNPDPETMNDEVIALCNKYKVIKLGMDKLGPGVPVHKTMCKAMPGRVQGIAYGDPAGDTSQYFNLRSEAWGKIKEWLPNAHIPNGMENEWIQDLCNIRYGYDNKGRYSIEQKKLYIARGYPSSDMADALGISLLVSDKLQKVTPLLQSRRDSDSHSDWMAN